MFYRQYTVFCFYLAGLGIAWSSLTWKIGISVIRNLYINVIGFKQIDLILKVQLTLADMKLCLMYSDFGRASF